MMAQFRKFLSEVEKNTHTKQPITYLPTYILELSTHLSEFYKPKTTKHKYKNNNKEMTK